MSNKNEDPKKQVEKTDTEKEIRKEEKKIKPQISEVPKPVAQIDAKVYHSPDKYLLEHLSADGKPTEKLVSIHQRTFLRTFKVLTEGKNPKYRVISEPKKK